MKATRAVAVLGSTGSIGTSGLQVCAAARDRFRVVALAANQSASALARQALEWQPDHLAIVDQEAAATLRQELERQAREGAQTPYRGEIHEGTSGLLDMIAACPAEVWLVGITGAACLPATFAVARRGGLMALANKESVVMAGPLLLEEVHRHDGLLIPVDSEHSAIHQALARATPREVRHLHLTGSGGPFRETPLEDFPGLTATQALQHPVWQMGPKITIDSATMMNKALEVVEARWLFEVDASRISVLVHPECIVHSMVEFVDGSILAQLGLPDMKVPIRHALGYPERVEASLEDAPGLVLERFQRLTFEEPDLDRFPALGLGFRAAREGGTMGAVLNAANEEAVRLFLEEAIGFQDIARLVGAVMDQHQVIPRPDLAAIERVSGWAREQVLGAAC